MARFSLSSSTFYTGLAGALVLLPQTFQFLTAPLVDRWSLRRTLLGTQVLQAVLVLTVPLAVLPNRFVLLTVLLVIPIAGLVNEFVYPAQSAALPRIVESDELVDANSAFSFAYDGVDFLFNAVSGALIALVDAVSLYLIDFATFAVSAFIFAEIRIPVAERIDAEQASSGVDNYAGKLREGIQYIRAGSRPNSRHVRPLRRRPTRRSRYSPLSQRYTAVRERTGCSSPDSPSEG